LINTHAFICNNLLGRFSVFVFKINYKWRIRKKMQIPILVVYSKSLHHFGWAISKQNAAFAISVFNHSINSPNRFNCSDKNPLWFIFFLTGNIKKEILSLCVDINGAAAAVKSFVSGTAMTAIRVGCTIIFAHV